MDPRRCVASADSDVAIPGKRCLGYPDLFKRQRLSWLSVGTWRRLGRVYGITVFKSPSTLVMTTVSIDVISRKCRSVAHDRALWATHSSWIMIEPEAKWDLNGTLIWIPFILPLLPSPISALSGYDEWGLRFCAGSGDGN